MARRPSGAGGNRVPKEGVVYRILRTVPAISLLAALAAGGATLGLSSSAFASASTPLATPDADEDVVPFSDRFPVEISISNHSEVYELARLGLDIDAAGETWVRAYLNQKEVDLVEGLGYPVKRIPNKALRMWRSIREQEDLGLKDAYHNYDELTAHLQGVAADHPSITRLISIGKSVQARDLWFFKITDYPDSQENEPEFKYISAIHGDEVVGVENCLKFIDWITDNYDSVSPDPWLKNIVDEVEIWIMPMMNPDGNTAGSRYNANGEDLNRNFPDWVDDPNNTPEGREPETQAMMRFSDSMSFDLSANFHGGEVVVNYPYDSRSPRAPDDSLFIDMSKAYSYHNPPMWNSSQFPYGITNGYDWYEIHGGMQDWNYDYMYNMEVTIELSENKWPPPSELPQFWADNDTSMVAYLEYCLRGVRGTVTDSASGSPLLATVAVEGIAWNDRTDPDAGDYHRILRPGIYTLSFSAPDYVTRRLEGIEIVANSATVLDIELARAPRWTVSGTVTSTSMEPLAAMVEAIYHPGGGVADSASTDPSDGSYELDVAQGQYDLTVRSPGYRTETLQVDVHSDTTFDFMLDPTEGNILVIDDYSGMMAVSKLPDREVELALPRLSASASEIAADLATLGYAAVLETAASTDPGTWASYDFVVWSSGNDISPVTSSAYRRNLIDYVAGGGSLLIEGGELAYDAVASPGYPNFADSVLHVGDWNGDNVGPLVLDVARADHPIATDPNILPGTIGITYVGYGDEDACTPGTGAYIVYGTSSYPSDAGLLVYDKGVRPGTVFYAFAYSAVTDRTDARNLLENTATYLLDEAAGARDRVASTDRMLSLDAAPNPFASSATITLALPRGDEIGLKIYDIRGRLVRTLATGGFEPGVHSLEWDGTDAQGRDTASGLYFLRLSGSHGGSLKKIVKLR